jgi:hypothetical protein
MKSFLFVFLSLFLVSKEVLSQQNYLWDEYGISFSLADDFVEETNNIDEFSAAGDGMYMSIIPFKDGSIDDSDIVTFTIEIAKSLNLQEIDDVDVLDLNYFQGGYVEGYKDGAKVFLMGMIDPNSDTNFFVIITFLDQDHIATEEAINIVLSINKM